MSSENKPVMPPERIEETETEEEIRREKPRKAKANGPLKSFAPLFSWG